MVMPSMQSSLLCQQKSRKNHVVSGLACWYNTEISTVLEWLIPQRTVICRRRPSDPCFDQKCQDANHRVHRLERASRPVSKTVTADPTLLPLLGMLSAECTTTCYAWSVKAFCKLRWSLNVVSSVGVNWHRHVTWTCTAVKGSRYTRSASLFRRVWLPVFVHLPSTLHCRVSQFTPVHLTDLVIFRVFKGWCSCSRVHGPWIRVSNSSTVNMDREHGCHFRHPFSRPMFTVDVFDTREHGSWTRVVWTGVW